MFGIHCLISSAEGEQFPEFHPWMYKQVVVTSQQSLSSNMQQRVSAIGEKTSTLSIIESRAFILHGTCLKEF